MHDLGCEVNQFGTDCLECGIRCNDCDVNNGCQKCSARFSGQHCQQCSPGYMGEDCGRNVYYKCFHICFDLFGGLHPTKEFYTHLETSFIWPRGSWILQYNVCILHITLRYHFLLFFNTLFPNADLHEVVIVWNVSDAYEVCTDSYVFLVVQKLSIKWNLRANKVITV